MIVAPFKTERPCGKKDILSGGVRCQLIFSDHAHCTTHIRSRHPEYVVNAYLERWNQERAQKSLESATAERQDSNQNTFHSDANPYGALTQKFIAE